MATPRRTQPLYPVWSDWALAGSLAIRMGDADAFKAFIAATTLVTASGMLRAGIRPASHPTSTSKE